MPPGRWWDPLHDATETSAFVPHSATNAAAWDGQGGQWVDRARRALDAANRAGHADETAYRWSLGGYLVYLMGDLDQGEVVMRESRDPMYVGLLMNSGIIEPALPTMESLTSQAPAACLAIWRVR